MKIKIDFTLSDCKLMAKILYMDDRFRCGGTDEDPKLFTASNGFEILSQDVPEFWIASTENDEDDIESCVDSIYLQGYKRYKDFEEFSGIFKNNYDRDIYLQNLIIALKEWSNSEEIWGTPPTEVHYPSEFQILL